MRHNIITKEERKNRKNRKNEEQQETEKNFITPLFTRNCGGGAKRCGLGFGGNGCEWVTVGRDEHTISIQ